MKNHLYLFLVSMLSLIISFSSVKAQSGIKKDGSNSINKGDRNFYDIQKSFNEYWKKKSANEVNKEEDKDGEWQQFKRWEWFAEQRVYPSGNFFDPEILVNEYFKYKAEHPVQKSLGDRTANWSFIGPQTVPGNGGGAGRINCIAFDPNNTNTIYIGAASGGLWKSTDGGSTWSSNTDLLPALSVSDIAINPQNPNVMYLVTGDKYGYIGGGLGFWGGNYSAGLVKSIDGGATWNLTSLNFIQSQARTLQRVIINPVNPNILIVASNNGIYRSNDAAATWTNVKPGNFMDLEINPLNPNVLYASDTANIFRSNNAGISWSALSGNLCPGGGRNSITVTPADTNIIYAWCSGGDFFKSTNGGAAFNLMSSPNSTAGPYGYYDMVLEVSPVNPNIVITGGFEISESTDGGNSWNLISDWSSWPSSNYVHADNHCIKFLPGSGSTLFSCNDGGVFKTTDGGSSWFDLSNGIDIKQYYRIACSALNPNLIYAGAQDNGTDRINGTTADQVTGGDGMNCLIDYSDDNIVYTSYQYGSFSKSTDGGNSFYDITPPGSSGEWTTPMVMDPNNPQILFVGYQDIYKSTDGGNSWNAISSSIDGGNNIYSIAVASSNPGYIYVASMGNIFRTIDGGTSWSTITQNLPVNNGAITGIAINASYPDNVWVTFSGYSNGNKVFNSTDGGLSWTNISGTLPNIPVNCIVYQNGSVDLLYIGTDFGVYYKDGTMNDWFYYNTGLPNVIIDELEIQYSASKLRAATYGRGIWESDLNNSTLVANDAGTTSILSPAGTYCNSYILPIVRIKNFGIDTLFSVTLNYQIDGGAVNTYSWIGVLPTGGTADITLPSLTLSSGNHTFNATTSNPNSAIDNNTTNDSYTVSFSINTTGTATPLVEGFVSSSFPPSGWTMQNGGNLLSRTTAVGGFGNSSDAVKASYFSISNGTAFLVSPSLNFSGLVAPVKLDFNVAYVRYDSTYHDSLFVDVSTDCGATFTGVYIKGDAALSTAANSVSDFTPLNSEWRAESINLNSYIGSSNVILRFEFKSGFGNNLYLDDINIYDSTTGINKLNEAQSIFIYPNPAFDQLTISGLQIINGEKINAEIYNSAGEKIFDGPITKNKIDIRNIKPGIYVIKITTSMGIVSRKFIKK